MSVLLGNSTPKRHLLGCNGWRVRICRPGCECWCHVPACPSCGHRAEMRRD